ncbi:copper homeostasis protein CutC [Neoasaia chiangmaiensis NBRC 101099]|uniref:PF03932 family protein CutC n=1 Tax=Neoasaia chiangmaiensis TaxID=320497 RepID=A0A1U9KP52_9PROT|nr:copper homeostasis protein CutC [Neoasaia chiangmaiensis]AQS87533.1 copper homeostasis protein CutC [Neoasaia chiangmaiensis]GBR42366.1 copper homeostasis protein CutC [Neoasaia chiangmaiensis NBRC 101099]GEN14075.1 copper homeostasis protein CutC [Neoasaia chiangmaiensis]
MIELEVCVDDVASLHAAQVPGVARVELCAALAVGGLTPSMGLMRLAVTLETPAYAMIRPRAGDFVFDAEEEAVMLGDIAAARSAGLAGVVLGASRDDGTLDIAMLARLSAACGTMGRTLHRAFDLVPEPLRALETAIELGFERILTSGGARTAPEGAAVLHSLTQAAAGRIEIMAGGGVNPANVVALVRETGVGAVHGSCRGPVQQYAPVVAALGFGVSRAPADPLVIEALRAALDTVDRYDHS